MRRLGAIFIALCMVLIAGSLAAVLYLAARLDGVGADHLEGEVSLEATFGGRNQHDCAYNEPCVGNVAGNWQA